MNMFLPLVFYFDFRKLRVNNPSKILINLCLALAVVNVIFLVGMQEYTLESHIGCKVSYNPLEYTLESHISCKVSYNPLEYTLESHIGCKVI
jgi:hypothetical protein